MATLKQRRAVANIVESRGTKAVSVAMLEAGYDPTTAKNPKNLTESKAWGDLLDKFLPDDLILESLAFDIREKPKNRTAELHLAAKLKGRLQETPMSTKTLIVVIAGQSASRYGAIPNTSTGNDRA